MAAEVLLVALALLRAVDWVATAKVLDTLALVCAALEEPAAVLDVAEIAVESVAEATTGDAVEYAPDDATNDAVEDAAEGAAEDRTEDTRVVAEKLENDDESVEVGAETTLWVLYTDANDEVVATAVVVAAVLYP